MTRRAWVVVGWMVAGAMLVGCEGDRGPTGPAGPEGLAGAAGAAGPQGTPGTQGLPGNNGTNGLACWDLNANGVGDVASEDLNGDGVVDVTDCQGGQGPNGALSFLLTAEVPAALFVTIDSVTINSPPVIDFTVTDGAGRGAIGLKAGSTGNIRFTIAKLKPAATASGDADAWVSYLNQRTTAGAAEASVPTSDRSGALVDHQDGSYTYTFAYDVTAATDPVSGAAIPFEPALTHRLVMQLSGSVSGVDLPPVNEVYDFVPGGGAVTTTREIVKNANCNECHGNLTLHGTRTGTQYCVLCHAAGVEDVDTGSPIDLAYMSHAIHGAAARDSEGLPGYGLVAGYPTPSPIDYSHIGYPQQITNCRKCHDGADAATPQGDNWKSKPTLETCGACHDYVVFEGTPSEGPHPAQADNSACATCHTPALIEAAHLTENATTHNPNVPTKVGTNPAEPAYTFAYEIRSVTLDASNYPVIEFRILKDGVPMDLTWANWPADLKPVGAGVSQSSPSFLVSYSVAQDGIAAPADFNNLGNGVAAGQPLSTAIADLANPPATPRGVLSAADSEGFYTATLQLSSGTTPVSMAVPAGAGLLSAALQGYFTQYRFFGADDTVGANNLGRHAISAVRSATGFLARRQVVDNAKCGNCHEWFEGHGGNRTYNIDVCTMCHLPNLSTSGRGTNTGTSSGTCRLSGVVVPCTLENRIAIGGATGQIDAAGFDETDPLTWPEDSNNLREMIHGLHAGHARSTPYTFVRDRGNSGVFFYDWSHVIFPGNLGDCESCHEPGTYTKVGDDVLLTTVAIPGTTGDRAGLLAARASVPNDEDIVSTPISGTCAYCHDSPLAAAHMEQNGGFVMAERSDARSAGTIETCDLCHGAGRMADVQIVHGEGGGH